MENKEQTIEQKAVDTATSDKTAAADQKPWHESPDYGFDESHRKVLSKYPDPAEALKALVAAQPLIHSRIVLPKEDATPEEKAKVRREILGKLGAPDQGDAYKLDEILPEGVRSNPGYATYKQKVEEVLLEGGYDPEHIKKLFDASNELGKVLEEDYEKSRKADLDALYGKDGWKTPEEQKTNLANAAAAAKKYGSEALAKLIEDAENPALIAMAHALWDATMREGKARQTESANSAKPQTPQALSDEFYAQPSPMPTPVGAGIR